MDRNSIPIVCENSIINRKRNIYTKYGNRLNYKTPIFNEYTNLNLESFKYEITKLKLYEIMISINLKINKKYEEICMEEIKWI